MTMSKLLARTKEFLKSEDGPTATEYAVLLALIVVVIIVAITSLGQAVSGKFDEVAGEISGTGATPPA
jgi:pilus assembly protein Flp/PilA